MTIAHAIQLRRRRSLFGQQHNPRGVIDVNQIEVALSWGSDGGAGLQVGGPGNAAWAVNACQAEADCPVGKITLPQESLGGEAGLAPFTGWLARGVFVDHVSGDLPINAG